MSDFAGRLIIELEFWNPCDFLPDTDNFYHVFLDKLTETSLFETCSTGTWSCSTMDPTLTREAVARAVTVAPEAWAAEWEEAWEAVAVASEVKCTSYALLKQFLGSNLNVL